MRGDDRLEHAVRQEVEERDADGDGDHHVHREGRGGTEPHHGGPAARRQDEGREHGLVRELAQEDDREDGEDDVELHGGLSVWCRT